MLAALPLLKRSLLSCLLLRIVPVSTGLVNNTIDDTIGDSTTGLQPSYFPPDSWAQGQQCSTCNIHSGTTADTIDVHQVFDATWHDSTYSVGGPEHGVAVSFIGTAVYVYNIIVNQIPGTTTFTNLTFWIDNALVGSYTHVPGGTTVFEYGVLVYSNTSLKNQEHFFTMSAGGANESLILFDRIVYTQDSDDSTSNSPTALSSPNSTVPISLPGSTPSLLTTSSSGASTSKSSAPIGAIVGGVVGGVVGIILLGLLAFWIARARRRTAARRPPAVAEKIDPFIFGNARRPPDQRSSRAPILPNLRLGRTRLMPRGPGSTTTTDASSSTETGDGFQGHRPRLPPLSPAETARSHEQAEYRTRIQALEAQVRALEVQQQVGASSDASGSRTQLSHGSTPRPRRSRSRNRSGRSGRSANASTAHLRSELTSLRDEIAALRGELSQDQLGMLEAVPSYVA
ncbi:hypothetical protein LXA43DRAFT_890118 [Ganoderma leucocontextum]|nr:hypothetical protein LXA43DRAFT_890118 [Ganoderma leucocontextum]